MKILKLPILTTLFVGLSGSAFAQQYDRYNNDNRYVQPIQTFTDYAKIRKVTPEYVQQNNPTQECRNEIIQESVPQNRNYGGAAIGGIAGGLLGNQIGKGNGRTAATAVGAVTGALVGDNVSNNNYGSQYQERTVQHCRNIDRYEQVLSGYKVEYEYRGSIRTIITRERPEGNRLKLNLQVAPDVNGY